MEQLRTYSPLIARLFIGGFFLLAGVGKIGDVAGTAGYIQSVGLPGVLAWPAIIFEIALGLALIVGFQTRIAALAGAAFCIFTAVFFHNNLADQIQMIMFLKNFSIAGAFSVIVRAVTSASPVAASRSGATSATTSRLRARARRSRRTSGSSGSSRPR